MSVPNYPVIYGARQFLQQQTRQEGPPFRAKKQITMFDRTLEIPDRPRHYGTSGQYLMERSDPSTSSTRAGVPDPTQSAYADYLHRMEQSRRVGDIRRKPPLPYALLHVENREAFSRHHKEPFTYQNPDYNPPDISQPLPFETRFKLQYGMDHVDQVEIRDPDVQYVEAQIGMVPPDDATDVFRWRKLWDDGTYPTGDAKMARVGLIQGKKAQKSQVFRAAFDRHVSQKWFEEELEQASSGIGSDYCGTRVKTGFSDLGGWWDYDGPSDAELMQIRYS
jgi:hypothetical protein